MHKGIVAYSISTESGNIELTRAYNNDCESISASSWDIATKWITRDFGEALHVTWNLEHFASVLFKLLPEEKRRELEDKPKIYIDGDKIFYTGNWLGITSRKHIKGNLYRDVEVNIFGLSNWLSNTDELNTESLVKVGERLLDALEKLGIRPEKLTSPIGVLTEYLPVDKLPTIFSNHELLDTCNACLFIKNLEWREVFQSSLYAPTYRYDMISAYPYFIRDLPDTNYCERVNIDEDYDWGITEAQVTGLKKPHPIVERNYPYYTTDELNWIERYQPEAEVVIGNNGYFFKWTTDRKPYKKLIDGLFNARANGDETISEVARRIGQGLSGKLDQENMNGTLGELYNPILATIVRSKCRLAVGAFIYDKQIEDELAYVEVDGISCFRELDIEEIGELGSWRSKK